jgi:hypothetical protein
MEPVLADMGRSGRLRLTREAAGVPWRLSSTNGRPRGTCAAAGAGHSRLTAGHRRPTCTVVARAIKLASMPGGGGSSPRTPSPAVGDGRIMTSGVVGRGRRPMWARGRDVPAFGVSRAITLSACLLSPGADQRADVETEGDHLYRRPPASAEPYVLGVMNPEKMLKTPWGSVYEQVMSELGSKPGIP